MMEPPCAFACGGFWRKSCKKFFYSIAHPILPWCQSGYLFEWSYDGEEYQKIGRIFDTTKFSDEYCKYGEFTGTMVGITCADRVKYQHYADFGFFEYKAEESRGVE